MIEEYALTVLAWEASTLKAKDKGFGHWMRMNDEAELGTANALSAPIASLDKGKGNGKMIRQSRVTYDVCINWQRALKEGVS
ncbi:UNVERIFIED_CONTAM: hypothetical protein Sradi_6541600 [Sesamum radiatum]|uniref:Uncharacterized protein n=1 Tax=Sesamum radiatum TaxID=300843 RepID=A0AAW2JXB8_SESRA